MTTTDLLTTRGQDYGTFTQLAKIAQALKDEWRCALAERGDGGVTELDDDMREALDLICTKIARIANGNPQKVDHWEDIAGYATLVADRLRGVAR